MSISLLKYNRHWEKSFRYSFNKKRSFFDLVTASFQKRQIFEIIGLRRTGKTTLLFQGINQLLDEVVPSESIWYFTFDEEKLPLTDLFQLFSQQTGVNLKKDRVYIFLDEIQKLKDFQSQLKVYYDLYPNIKFFISGSTSLFIKKKTQESLAGRITARTLYPLNFKEYLYFKNKDNILDKPLMYKQEIETEFEIFLQSQFIESVFMNNREERREYFTSIIKKIIFEDIPTVFPINNPEVLWRLVNIIASKPGILIDYNEMSKELGISRNTISSYLYYLEESFLVKKIYNFSRNLITSEKKLKKFYLASPSFSWALAPYSEKGYLVENLIISLKDYKFFWRDAYKHEVDFIDTDNDKIIPIEIKYKENIRQKELNNLCIFAQKFKISEAIVILKNIETAHVNRKDTNISLNSIYFE
ncbi:ATP-binding protein [bacterium]